MCRGACLPHQLMTVVPVGDPGPYLGCDAPQARGVAPTAGVCARGPRDGLVVEDGEGELAISDKHGLERVDLPRSEA